MTELRAALMDDGWSTKSIIEVMDLWQNSDDSFEWGVDYLKDRESRLKKLRRKVSKISKFFKEKRRKLK